jgi:hypothetical protein
VLSVETDAQVLPTNHSGTSQFIRVNMHRFEGVWEALMS